MKVFVFLRVGHKKYKLLALSIIIKTNKYLPKLNKRFNDGKYLKYLGDLIFEDVPTVMNLKNVINNKGHP